MPTDVVAESLRERLETALGESVVLGAELGGGGMSVVFAAFEPALERRVAVKALSPALTDVVDAERFRREVLLLARLQHPHIVPILRAGDAGGVPYFVMPYVEGESLRARLLRAGALPLGEAVRILRSVAAALAYAHARGVVHRDVKPDNVLLSAGGIATVTDFGVARALDVALGSHAIEPAGEAALPHAFADDAPASTLTGIGYSVGTPAYMAPEQAAADPDLDHRADLYAFGVLAYELFTGDVPFASRSAAATLAAHAVEPPAPITTRRADLPPRVASLVMHCLEKRPTDRPQTADYLVAVLDALLVPGGEVTRQDRAPTPAHEPPRGRGRRAAVRGALALLLAAALTGAALAWRAGRVPAERPRVLLTAFGGAGADSILSGVLAETVRTDVSQSRALSLVPPQAVERALGELRVAPAAMDVSTARAVSARLEAPAAVLVSGAVTDVGGIYAIRVQLVAARTGDVLAAFQESAKGLGAVMPAVERLSAQARRALEEL